MKIELELGTNELGHDLIEQFFIWKLKETYGSLVGNPIRHTHPDDIKQDKKLAKACKRLLSYYGVKV